MLGVLEKISLKWNDIVQYVEIFTQTNELVRIANNNLRLEFPNCFPLDISSYLDGRKGIKQIFFGFYIKENIGVQIIIEDKKLVSSRTIKNNLLSYIGSPILLKGAVTWRPKISEKSCSADFSNNGYSYSFFLE